MKKLSFRPLNLSFSLLVLSFRTSELNLFINVVIIYDNSFEVINI